MKEWFTPAEIARLKLPFTPHTARNISALADRENWRMPDREYPANPGGVWRKREGRGGGYEYRIAVLNSQAQAALLRKLSRAEAKAAPAAQAAGPAAVRAGAQVASAAGQPRQPAPASPTRPGASAAAEPA